MKRLVAISNLLLIAGYFVYIVDRMVHLSLVPPQMLLRYLVSMAGAFLLGGVLIGYLREHSESKSTFYDGITSSDLTAVLWLAFILKIIFTTLG